LQALDGIADKSDIVELSKNILKISEIIGRTQKLPNSLLMLKENLDNKKAFYEEKITQNEGMISSLLSTQTPANTSEANSKTEKLPKKAELTEPQERLGSIGVPMKMQNSGTKE
jgi:hypothetical protein